MTEVPSDKPSSQIRLEFPHSPQLAEEYLRLALRRMGEVKLAPTPINYSVFYAEAAGIDRNLQQELQGIRKEGRPLTNATVKALFQRYLVDCDELLTNRYREDLLNIVAETLDALSEFAGTTAAAGEGFEKKAARLTGSVSLENVLGVVRELIADSRSLARHARSVESQLEDFSEDIGRLQSELKRAREEADTDGLTGLLNRRAFWNSLENCLASVNQSLPVVCLMMLDIDHFKQVNDTHGHIIGDWVLKKLSHTLRDAVKGRDKVARIGGEEFAILLPHTMVSGARSVAEDIRKRVAADRIPLGGDGVEAASVTISLGIAAYRKGESKEDFFERCDRALYRAKRQGRNRVIAAE
jgi:diguanylate cyclase